MISDVRFIYCKCFQNWWYFFRSDYNDIDDRIYDIYANNFTSGREGQIEEEYYHRNQRNERRTSVLEMHSFDTVITSFAHTNTTGVDKSTTETPRHIGYNSQPVFTNDRNDRIDVTDQNGKHHRDRTLFYVV